MYNNNPSKIAKKKVESKPKSNYQRNIKKSSDINNATYTSIESLVNNTNIQKRKDLILMKDYNKVLKEMRKSIVSILITKNSSVSVNSTNLIDKSDISSILSVSNLKNSFLKNKDKINN